MIDRPSTAALDDAVNAAIDDFVGSFGDIDAYRRRDIDRAAIEALKALLIRREHNSFVEYKSAIAEAA